MIKCIIVDDEPLARTLISGHILEVPYVECLGTFKNAVLASEFLSKHTVDLIFLDIQMPKLNGIDFLKSLKNPPKVIFTTAYREYAVESYELQVIDYLLKPITFSRFFQAINKLNRSTPEVEVVKNNTPEHIFVQANKKYIKIILENILYVESLKDYLKIHLRTESILIKERISTFIKILPDQQFMQVHRSYIIAVNKVTAFTHRDIEIGNIEIPIGGLYKEQVLMGLKT